MKQRTCYKAECISFKNELVEKDGLHIREPLLKRPFDVFLSAIGLIISFPIWVIVAALIWIEDGRPIFYSQKRLGKDSKEFWLVKFRSMVKNAEQQTGPVWAGKEDHRVTRVGRILRRTALDELPQLFNILKGDMSFVGPRAERPEFAREFEKAIPQFNQRLLVRSGLTGLAQVRGRYNTSPRNKLRYDLLYIENQSFLLDLKLILLSFWMTFTLKWSDAEKKVDKLIGQIMLEAGFITEKQLMDALEHQNKWGGKIGENLLRRGYISEPELKHCLNIQIVLNGKMANGRVYATKDKNGKINTKLIGQVMLEAGVITSEQLEDALENQRKFGGKLGENLVRKKYISESELDQFLGKQR